MIITGCHYHLLELSQIPLASLDVTFGVRSGMWRKKSASSETNLTLPAKMENSPMSELKDCIEYVTSHVMGAENPVEIVSEFVGILKADFQSIVTNMQTQNALIHKQDEEIRFLKQQLQVEILGVKEMMMEQQQEFTEQLSLNQTQIQEIQSENSKLKSKIDDQCSEIEGLKSTVGKQTLTMRKQAMAFALFNQGDHAKDYSRSHNLEKYYKGIKDSQVSMDSDVSEKQTDGAMKYSNLKNIQNDGKINNVAKVNVSSSETEILYGTKTKDGFTKSEYTLEQCCHDFNKIDFTTTSSNAAENPDDEEQHTRNQDLNWMGLSQEKAA